MEIRLCDNIVRFRKSKGYTQEELAKKLNISSQAVSKWENAQSLPDIALLPALAGILETDIDTLMGYIPKKKMVTPYEDRYNAKEYYWGTMPNEMCMEVLRRYYPTRPLRLLEVGCGEGKDAVFFARNGYQVTAFDVTESGIEKPEGWRISIRRILISSVRICVTSDWMRISTLSTAPGYSIISCRSCGMRLWKITGRIQLQAHACGQCFCRKALYPGAAGLGPVLPELGIGGIVYLL